MGEDVVGGAIKLTRLVNAAIDSGVAVLDGWAVGRVSGGLSAGRGVEHSADCSA